MPDAETTRLTQEGIAAVRRGDKAAARRSLLEAVERDRQHEEAWLWLSAALDEPEQQAVCLQNVLRINPNNKAALRGLTVLGKAPNVTPGIQSLTPAQPPEPDWQAPLEHSAPGVIDDGLNAMLSGTLPPAPVKRSAPPGEDNWREALYDPEMVSKATRVGTKVIEKPNLSFMDLVNTWIDLLILNPHGGLDAELEHSGPGRIAVNIFMAALLSILASVVGTAMLVMLPASGVNLPLMNSANAVLENIAASGELDMPPDASVTVDQMEAELAPLLASSGAMIAASACLIIPGLFIGLFIYAFFVNGVSWMANGKGTFSKTLTGLSLGLVSNQFVSVIFALLLPLMPLGLALVVGLLVGFYQLLIYAVPLGRAHNFGTFASLGMLILGQTAASFGIGGLCGCLSIGLSMLAQ